MLALQTSECWVQLRFTVLNCILGQISFITWLQQVILVSTGISGSSLINFYYLPQFFLSVKQLLQIMIKPVCLTNTLYFHSIFESLSGHLFPKPMPLNECNEISDVDVCTELAQLDPTKAIGIDGIGPKVLTHYMCFFSIPIYSLPFLYQPNNLYNPS